MTNDRALPRIFNTVLPVSSDFLYTWYVFRIYVYIVQNTYSTEGPVNEGYTIGKRELDFSMTGSSLYVQ
jgi:hypothetical protein